MSKSRCKVEIPCQLPSAGLTRVQFKTWKEAMVVYLKQNEDFTLFLPGGRYEFWKRTDEHCERVESLDHVDLENLKTKEEKDSKLTQRRTDLHTMLNIIGSKVDQYDYDDVLNVSTSLESIWIILEQTYDIGRKGVQFLELQNIHFEKNESPAKFYKKVYHLVMDNLYKRDESFNNSKMESNEKLTPTFLNFIMYYVLERIDSRLVKEVKDKWGHLLDANKSLHEMKDVILKGIPDMLQKLENQDPELSAFTNSNRSFPRYRGRGSGTSHYKKGNRIQDRNFCRLCQTAGEPRRIYTSHSMSSCRRWTKKDVEDLRHMMVVLEVDPNDYESSDSDE